MERMLLDLHALAISPEITAEELVAMQRLRPRPDAVDLAAMKLDPTTFQRILSGVADEVTLKIFEDPHGTVLGNATFAAWRQLLDDTRSPEPYEV